jgi:hypothetical protein
MSKIGLTEGELLPAWESANQNQQSQGHGVKFNLLVPIHVLYFHALTAFDKTACFGTSGLASAARYVRSYSAHPLSSHSLRSFTANSALGGSLQFQTNDHEPD